MPTPVTVPPLGESVTSAILIQWLKNDGDTVAKDEPICLLETDKANVDLPSPEAGVLKQLRKVGETIPVGSPVAEVSAGTGGAAPAKGAAAAAGGAGAAGVA